MSRYYPAFTALTLILVAGLVHGFWTDRWVVSTAPAEAAARLEQLPLEAGDWKGEPLEVNSKSAEAITGRLCRRYTNRSTGSVVTIALVSGLPGPVSIHTPDVCYKAGGFDVASPVHHQLPAEAPVPAAEFLTSDLHKTRAAEQLHQRIFWSWNATGTWQAPANPRWEFAAEPVLYKLYVVRDMSAPGEPLEDDPCLDLLRSLLPQLQKTLFAQP